MDRDDVFLGRSDVRGKEDCWEWRGAKSSSGYGAFYYKKKFIYAHRYSWMIKNGEIPDKMFVCHTCDNPSCVNPNHLFLGTHSDNMKDRNKKGRSRIPRGERHSFSKLKRSGVRKIRNLYSSRDLTQYELADLYSVHVMTINNLIKRKTWAWLK